MTGSVVLNNVDHKDLKILTTRGKNYGDDVNGVLVFPSEFVDVHKEYPIYFQKSAETGEFQTVALFGFSKDENLFIEDDSWSARYIPALIRREPFHIGLRKDAGQESESPVILVDLESPRVSSTEDGEAVFKEGGGNTAFLDDANNALSLVHEGIPASKAMLDAFLKLELIESIMLDIQFKDGSKYQTDMFYTINQERLLALDSDVVADLHKSGLLQIAYMVMESLGNIRHLIEKRDALS